jgi:hypothetical protein
MEYFVKFFTDNKDIISFITTISLFIIGFIINSRARRIQELMVFKEFREPLIRFANDSIDTLTEIEGLCELNPEILGQEFFNRYHNVINKISSLRDKGKLIIPNDFPEKYGTHKAEAYKGFRHETLDCLAAAYYIAISINFQKMAFNRVPIMLSDENIQNEIQGLKIKKGLDKLPDGYCLAGPSTINKTVKGWSSKQAIVETKRQFVSKVQSLIKTRDWREKIIELSKQSKNESIR